MCLYWKQREGAGTLLLLGHTDGASAAACGLGVLAAHTQAAMQHDNKVISDRSGSEAAWGEVGNRLSWDLTPRSAGDPGGPESSSASPGPLSACCPDRWPVPGRQTHTLL